MSAMTPPDKCPICGLAMIDDMPNASDGPRRYFFCGLVWKTPVNQYGDHYYGACASATLAALRCGATLHPTAREQAREALVAAAAEYKNANDALYAQALEVRGDGGTYDRVNKAYTALLDTTDAYLATEPAP